MLAERSTRSRFAPRRRNSTTRRSASMAVIDAHAHIYPNKIASRAVDAVGDFYLIDIEDACSAADKPELQRLADQYIPDWTKLDWAEL